MVSVKVVNSNLFSDARTKGKEILWSGSQKTKNFLVKRKKFGIKRKTEGVHFGRRWTGVFLHSDVSYPSLLF